MGEDERGEKSFIFGIYDDGFCDDGSRPPVRLPASNSYPYALEMVRLCLERVPAALFFRGRIGVYLGKMAILAYSLRSSFLSLPLLLCFFLLTLGLTRALFSCFGRDGVRETARFSTSRWSSMGPSTGVSWRPAAHFARGSAFQLFDDRPRAPRQQRLAASRERLAARVCFR